MASQPFHYAFKVHDLESTRGFYGGLIGCKEGRSTEHWVDFDFFGSQISAHISDAIPELDYCGDVDGVSVPIPHFGAVLSRSQFDQLRESFERENYDFIVKPQVRYEGKAGEQLTMFVLDPSGNPLEFKSISNEDELFEE